MVLSIQVLALGCNFILSFFVIKIDILISRVLEGLNKLIEYLK